MKNDLPEYPKLSDVERCYRAFHSGDLMTFRVVIGESDLWVSSNRDIRSEVERVLTIYRRQLKEYIHANPEFAVTLQPYPGDPRAPAIVQWMIAVSAQVGVGPMAAVAGAVAGMVGQNMMPDVTELIVENGGDIYLRSSKERTIGIFAGNSPFSRRIGVKINPKPAGFGICTSSGTVGPSLSLGRADATVICASDPALADAAATAVGNLVMEPADLEKAIRYAQTIFGLSGAVIIKDDKMCAWGEIDFVPIDIS